MHHDDHVPGEPDRRPRRRSELGEALDAVHDTGSLREALDGTGGAAAAEPDGELAVVSAARSRWPRHVGRAIGRVDVWILIVTAAGVIIAYLTLVQPR